MSTLVLTFGSHSVQIHPESTPFSVGRDPDNDFFLDHDVVSGHHGKVIHEEGQFLFLDLSSTNGSFLKSSDGRSTRKSRIFLNGAGSIRLGVSGPEIAFAVSFDHGDATDGFPLSDQRGIECLQKGGHDIDFIGYLEERLAPTFDSPSKIPS